MDRQTPRAFTIVEMLVVVSIIGVLMAMLLPAVNNARDKARVTVSRTNLRQLGTAHANYAAEWEDRQFTLAVDNIASYALEPYPGPPGPEAAASMYATVKAAPNPPQNRDYPPPIELGWCTPPGGSYVLWVAGFDPSSPSTNLPHMAPINFDPNSSRFGWFRIPNAGQFNQYVSGRFYDPVFYAPKDVNMMDYIKPGLESPEQFVATHPTNEDYLMAHAGWSSYCLSPAALFNPSVMRHDDPDDPNDGWQDPWSIPAGMRAPSIGQARYTSLKTHMIEHNWLQNAKTSCSPFHEVSENPRALQCEAWGFNNSWESQPVTLFYDGHVEMVGVRELERAHLRAVQQNGWGLWSDDTAYGGDGYFQSYSYDNANTSFHILTTDGILGRDIVSN